MVLGLTSACLRLVSTMLSNDPMSPEEATINGRDLSKLLMRQSELQHVNIPDALTTVGLLYSEGPAMNGISRLSIVFDRPAGLVALLAPLREPPHSTRLCPRLVLTTLADLVNMPMIMDTVNSEGMTMTVGCCARVLGGAICVTGRAGVLLPIIKGANIFDDGFRGMHWMLAFMGGTRGSVSSPALTSRVRPHPCAWTLGGAACRQRGSPALTSGLGLPTRACTLG